MPEAARAILEDFGRGFSPTQARDSTMRGSVGDRRRKRRNSDFKITFSDPDPQVHCIFSCHWSHWCKVNWALSRLNGAYSQARARSPSTSSDGSTETLLCAHHGWKSLTQETTRAKTTEHRVLELLCDAASRTSLVEAIWVGNGTRISSDRGSRWF